MCFPRKLLLTTMLLLSCGGRPTTWVTKSYCYPESEPEASCRQRLTVTISADATKGFADRYNKDLWVRIHNGEGQEILRRGYAAEAGDLKSGVKWADANNVQVSFHEATAAHSPDDLRQVLLLAFVRGSDGKFMEASVPSWVSKAEGGDRLADVDKLRINAELPWSPSALKGLPPIARPQLRRNSG